MEVKGWFHAPKITDYTVYVFSYNGFINFYVVYNPAFMNIQTNLRNLEYTDLSSESQASVKVLYDLNNERYPITHPVMPIKR